MFNGRRYSEGAYASRGMAKQRGIEKLKPIKDVDESMQLFTLVYNLTPLEKNESLRR
ncbi:hypothetical protein INT80_11260 [Gallibacterium anatis]|uniref:Uncharacterized protein n=1 Tax=Gallibacterium anatis TaxID=750 RepID=A0A930UX73_9PAST|nr:hypothetical protein [Gallibacterium anatis]